MSRFALVTAAGGGLGAAIAAHLERSGFTVLAHYRSTRPPVGRPLQADLTSAEARRSLIDVITQQTGRLDLLVNNLGVYPEQSLPDISLDVWNDVLETTVTANFHLTQLATPLLQSGCRVINIGDSGADRITARVMATPYHVAKIGVNVLTRSFARVLGPRGVTVNMVSPGFLDNSVGEAPDVPAGRLGTFDDITGAIDYLLQADHTNGANIVVSGGWNV